MSDLLNPREVDLLLGYPSGRTLRLVKAGKIPSITLPDRQIRIAASDLELMLVAGASTTIQTNTFRGESND